MKAKINLKYLPIIAITMGDPNGIGPEIILKLHRDKKVRNFCLPVVIGDIAVLESYSKLLGIKSGIYSIRNSVREEVRSGKSGEIMVIDEGCFDIKDLKPGKIQAECGSAAVRYIKKAVELALDGEIDGIATAPISKEAMNRAGFNYPGHTELLGELTRTKHFTMMFIGGELNVALVTTHMALKDVPKAIKKERVYKTIEIVNNGLKDFGIKTPKIAVCALNPHGGEGGIFGNEEEKEILPAILEAKDNGFNAEGPYSADTLFYRAAKEKFDAVISMYHDQGLIPVKIKGFGRSVNATMGLPIIRTSVDHGTAFDIAGKGVADHKSLLEALRIAGLWARKKIKD